MLIFTLDELLSELGIVENTLRARIEKDGFPHPRKMGATGHKIFWNVSEVAEWLMRCPKAWGGDAEDIASE
ncbi:helix-turn-helix transcriptional regulator [Diaphorobacter caeni]|uniref:helix-turn-helix transcriptional regulator n=1 Tax=Diaphorobacter caeni TaxID=2784387 RepID=UPI00188E5972|nr:hypothetical protein [Diaphorobacter caeni]MBF5006982.1 hypothetical protein [Diaphorobacter caeni]